MNKSIKIFETYLKRLGRNTLFWDEELMSFLMITDRAVLKRLSGLDFKDENASEQISRLYDNFALIDNYEGRRSDKKIIQTQNELFTIAHRNTFPHIDLHLRASDPAGSLIFWVKVQANEWEVSRRNEEWQELLALHEVHDAEGFVRSVNEKGPSIESLFFIEFFLRTGRSPQQQVRNLLATTGYAVKQV